MKLYWSMPDEVKIQYRQELKAYKSELSRGNLQGSWRYLERAHILGQPWPREHSHVHWIMLMFGIKIKNTKEILGQISRLLIGGVKSFVGNIPVGNTGGTNVPPLLPMDIPDDLKKKLQQFKE